MNKFSIKGTIISVNEQVIHGIPVKNILLADNDAKLRPVFQTAFWGMEAEKLKEKIHKGDIVDLEGFISTVRDNGKGPIIVINNCELKQIQRIETITFMDEADEDEDLTC